MSTRPRTSDAAGKANGAETGRRLLDVLLLFSSSRPTWTIQDISKSLGFSLSTTYRYVSALKDSGLIDRFDGSQYRVTELAFVLAEAARRGLPAVSEIARATMQRIRDDVDESVFLARRAGWNVIMIAREESKSPVRLQFEPGRPMLLHSGSLSRVLLAAMPEAERERYLSSLAPATRNKELLSDTALELVRRTGDTESFEEVDKGIWGTAAAVITSGEGTFALGCAAPLYRNDEGRRQHIRTLITEGARELTDLLSGSTRGM